LWANEFTRSNSNSGFSKNSKVEEFKSNNEFELIGVAGGPLLGAPIDAARASNKLLLLFLLNFF
jgi:hypothetical protein